MIGLLRDNKKGIQLTDSSWVVEDSSVPISNGIEFFEIAINNNELKIRMDKNNFDFRINVPP